MTSLFSTTTAYYHSEETSYEEYLYILKDARSKNSYTIVFNFAGQQSGKADYLIGPGSILFIRDNKKEFTYVGRVRHLSLAKEKRGKMPALYELELSIRPFNGIASGTEIERNDEAIGNHIWKDSALFALGYKFKYGNGGGSGIAEITM